MTGNITFEKATIAYKEIIFSWLAEPHVQEFWDNTQGHKDDILNFMGGRKEPSNYCDGKYIYWIALDSGKPYAMLMTICETIKDDIGTLKLSHLSKTGHTYGLDYMIGSTEHIGKGYGSKTLIEFVDFFRDEFDKKADIFLIDPASDNPRAKRVYEKAGFKHIADFVMGGNVSGSGKQHHLLIKKFAPTLTLEPISIDNYHIIQNMAQLYVYDASRELGFSISEDGRYNPKSYRCYCEDSDKVAYIIKVYDEIAGFALINEKGLKKYTDWKVDQFFILTKFQRSGIGKAVAEKIWQMHPGKWEVSVIPENTSALKFWENAISKLTDNVFEKETKLIDFDKDQPKRIIFSFDSENRPIRNSKCNEFAVVKAGDADIGSMNVLSRQKRLAYEKAQPQFWKWAGDSGEEIQKTWFRELISDDNHICLVAKNSNEILGFIIGKIVSAPEVYAPGGQTLIVDDFCVLNDNWSAIGNALLSEARSIAHDKGVAQLVIVSGDHDVSKKSFLKKLDLSIASVWFVGGVL